VRNLNVPGEYESLILRASGAEDIVIEPGRLASVSDSHPSSQALVRLIFT
jgi:hypothetical protein